MPLFTHPDPKAWHALALAQNFHHFSLLSNEAIAKHVDDVWPQFNASRKMCSQTLRRALIKVDSLSLAETSTHEVLLPHVQTPRHGPLHVPKAYPLKQNKTKTTCRYMNVCTPLSIDTWVQTPEYRDAAVLKCQTTCLPFAQLTYASQNCWDR